MSDKPQPSRDPLKAAATRTLWACGLCFGVTFLVGLSGVATITMLFDRYTVDHATGIEGAVVETVRAIKTPIAIVHAWGGYFMVLLGGWAGFEFFRLAKGMRKSGQTEIRRAARLTGVSGVAGAAILVIATVLLSFSGVSTKDKLEAPPPPESGSRNPLPVQSFHVPIEDPSFVMHTRDFNILLGLGAIFIVAATMGAQRVRRQMREEPQSAPADE